MGVRGIDTPTEVSEMLQMVRKYGFEYFGLYYGTYRGVVVDNKDPKKLGRVKLRVPQLASDNKIEYWAWPKGQVSGKDFGDFFIPPKGSPVWVECENGDPRHPIWLGGHWAKENGEVPSEGGGDPGNRVRKTEKWTMEMNDTGDFFHIKSKSGNAFSKLDGQGNYTMEIAQNHSLKAQGDKSEEVSGNKSEQLGGDKSVTISGNRTEDVDGDVTETTQGKRLMDCDEFGLTTNKGTFNFGGITFDISTPNQLVISVGASSIVINAGGVAIMGRDFLTHHHKDVLPGPGNTGDVV